MTKLKQWVKEYWALLALVAGAIGAMILAFLGSNKKSTAVQMVDAQADADKQKAAVDATADKQQAAADQLKRDEIQAAANTHTSYVQKSTGALNGADAQGLLKQWDAINDQPLE